MLVCLFFDSPDFILEGIFPQSMICDQWNELFELIQTKKQTNTHKDRHPDPTNMKVSSYGSFSVTEPEDGDDEDGVDRYWEVIHLLNAIDTVCVVYFTLEYVIRFLCAPRKFKFLFQPMNLVDLFAITPFFLTIFLHQLEDVQIIGKAGKIIRLTLYS